MLDQEAAALPRQVTVLRPCPRRADLADVLRMLLRVDRELRDVRLELEAVQAVLAAR